MSKSGLAVLGGLATLIALALPSSAAPYVGQYRALSLTWQLPGPGSSYYEFDALATMSTVSSSEERALYVDVLSCRVTCVRVAHFKQALQPAAIAIAPDLTSASLDAMLAGVRLRVQAAHTTVSTENPGFDVYSTELVEGDPGLRFDVNQRADSLQIQLGAHQCTNSASSGELMSFQWVAASGDGADDGSWATAPVSLAALGRSRGC